MRWLNAPLNLIINPGFVWCIWQSDYAKINILHILNSSQVLSCNLLAVYYFNYMNKLNIESIRRSSRKRGLSCDTMQYFCMVQKPIRCPASAQRVQLDTIIHPWPPCLLTAVKQPLLSAKRTSTLYSFEFPCKWFCGWQQITLEKKSPQAEAHGEAACSSVLLQDQPMCTKCLFVL